MCSDSKMVLTSMLDLSEEGSYLFPLYNVSDDMTCNFGVGSTCNDYRGATLQGPNSSFYLLKKTTLVEEKQL